MARTVVFQTPGVLDLRALTIMGLNVKPNSNNPIGYFGTGFKYAVAVLARHEIPVTIITNGVTWRTQPSTGTFRGVGFRPIDLVRERKILPATHRTLPFTCDLGRNWKLMHAMRELESNTRDEKGLTYTLQDGEALGLTKPKDTYIVIESDEFAQCVDKMDEMFLKTAGKTCVFQSERIHVYTGESKFVYYRGIKVHELTKPSLYTYNILNGLELTEDRTAKYSFQVDGEIARIAKEAKWEDRDLCRKLITAGEDYHEGGIDFKDDYWTSRPGGTFVDVVESERYSPRLSRSALSSYDSVRPPTHGLLDTRTWWEDLAEAVNRGDYDEVNAIIADNKDAFLELLEQFASTQRATTEPNKAPGGSETVGIEGIDNTQQE